MENSTRLTINDVPRDFARCYNSQCAQCGECLHHQAALLTPADCYEGAAVYPQAWAGGACRRFRTCRPVRMAWGFNSLYRRLDKETAALARAGVHQYFGSGNGPYYRYHHGERLLSPAQQQAVLDIMAHYGDVSQMAFDHYVQAFDFTGEP